MRYRAVRHYLCSSNDVPEGTAKGFDTEHHKLVIVRRNNVVFAYTNHCPHIGVPLNWAPDIFLDSDNDFIQCATHGALFLMDTGECVSGPCVGQSLQTVTLEEKEGRIYLITRDD